ncbi:MAG: aminotransferase class V-fold PLP-dependent enzyme [Thermodesulfobacteriota bacterium]
MFDKKTDLFQNSKSLFLGHCSISPLFQGAADAIIDYHREMAAGGITALPQFFETMDRFHKNGARFLHTEKKNISYVHNTAEAMGLIANGYPFEAGEEVISYIHEYPSNHYPWRLQENRGVRLKLLPDRAAPAMPLRPNQPNGWSMEDLESLVTDRTRLLAVSHVQFATGYAADLYELGQFCKERNIDLVVDCAQSLGCLPVYPEKYHISALAASSWKWLMGPKGSGFFYTSEKFRKKIQTTMTGAAMMKQGLDYLNHDWAPLDDGQRFEYSTLPWDHISGLNAIFEQIFIDQDMVELRDEVFRLQDILAGELDPDLVEINRFENNHRSGILTAVVKTELAKLSRDLLQQQLVVTSQGGYLRLAPHFYMSDEQMVQAAGLINQAVRS